MSDLSKMSPDELIFMCDECNYPGIRDELARRLSKTEAELADARASLAVARDGLIRLGDGDVEYHHGSYPEQGHYNEICAMQKEAQRTLAKMEQKGDDNGNLA